MPARSRQGRKPAIKRKLQEIEEAVPEKVFKSPWERDVSILVEQIKLAGTRGFAFPGSESNLKMMELCAAPALCDVIEDRTEMQNQMVRLISEGINDMDARMKAELVTMNTRLAEADSILAGLNGARDAAEALVNEKNTALTQCREKLSEKKLTQGEALAAWKEAKKELGLREKKQADEQAVLDALIAAYDTEFMLLTKIPEPPAPLAEGEEAPAAPVEEPVVVEAPKSKRSSTSKGKGRRNSAPKEPTIEDRIERILAQMRLYGADASLLNALPYALKDALTPELGDFGRFSLEKCTEFFKEKRVTLEGNLLSAKKLVDEQATLLGNKQTELDAQNLEVNSCKEAVTAAAEAVKLANKDHKLKLQDIIDHGKKNEATRVRVGNMDAWMREMTMVIQTFSLLAERRRPPPAPEPVLEPVVQQVEAMEISEAAPEAVPMETA